MPFLIGLPPPQPADAAVDQHILEMQLRSLPVATLDLGAGTLTFYLNGVKHGPGWTGIVGPVKRCVEIGERGDSVTLVRTEPAFRD